MLDNGISNRELCYHCLITGMQRRSMGREQRSRSHIPLSGDTHACACQTRSAGVQTDRKPRI
jgi:hypothetical protein